MAINSRSKGARNERRAAELFTKWTGKKFSKTAASGGLNWKASFSIGDIVCTTEGHYFPFAVEVKAHKEINFQHLMYDVKGCKIKEFWDQCSRDAERGKKIPMLMMRYDGLPADLFFIALPTDYFNYVYNTWDMDCRTFAYYHGKGYDFTIINSLDFFKLPYKEIKTYTKTLLKKKYGK